MNWLLTFMDLLNAILLFCFLIFLFIFLPAMWEDVLVFLSHVMQPSKACA